MKPEAVQHKKPAECLGTAAKTRNNEEQGNIFERRTNFMR
jgi:hypothetical protein